MLNNFTLVKDFISIAKRQVFEDLAQGFRNKYELNYDQNGVKLSIKASTDIAKSGIVYMVLKFNDKPTIVFKNQLSNIQLADYLGIDLPPVLDNEENLDFGEVTYLEDDSELSYIDPYDLSGSNYDGGNDDTIPSGDLELDLVNEDIKL